GNEIRKILETTSNSITFAMFGNYKLKRFFEGRDKGQVSNPTTTTVTYTTTITTTPPTTASEEKESTFEWHPVRKDGAVQGWGAKLKADAGWKITGFGWRTENHGNGDIYYLGKSNEQYDGNGNLIYIELNFEAIFTTDNPEAKMDLYGIYTMRKIT
ncbi:MAG: hypothetical protein DSO09_01040, partial [Candidatus Methanomethylicota archaeon]